MEVLDRIFDRQNMRRARGVNPVDHGGQRGGLAAAGRPSHQHETTGPVGESAQDRRKPTLFERAEAAKAAAAAERQAALAAGGGDRLLQ